MFSNYPDPYVQKAQQISVNQFFLSIKLNISLTEHFFKLSETIFKFIAKL